jgi:hypothetical protein
MSGRFSCEYPEVNDGYIFPDAKVDEAAAGQTALKYLCSKFSGGVQE